MKHFSLSGYSSLGAVFLGRLVPLVVLAFAPELSAGVKISELKDRLRVEVDGKLFTEWRHKEWTQPYLYPIIGPNGETVTRHYPIRKDVPNERPDHPHHRSIRFTHSDVNGLNFWWGASKEKAGYAAEVKLERIEHIKSGRTGEAVFWNRWLGDGKLVLREKVRLVFTPLKDRQMLVDYDVELHAGDAPVHFGDQKDGGFMVRVAGTMKVAGGKGTILNSRGNRNANAWGKRAEWADYYGPDASGKTVGIAIFDHPSNLRFPAHWHARTYGLITANRFGIGRFEAKKGAGRWDGNYTIAPGKSLKLRHRLYFHHGTTEAAKVAEEYKAYVGKVAGKPAQPAGFRHARITDVWSAYAEVLTFGQGQTLALVDDGCKMSMPEWKAEVNGVPKVRVTHDAVDGDDDPKHEGRGYHGSTIGMPSSVNFNGKLGVAYNNQVAVIRGLECCHCKVADSKSLAKALQWVLDNHEKHRITTVNLAPVDDKAHAAPVPTEIDAKLAALRKAGIWVSAPAGNHNFTTGISWPASQPNCFAIGAVRPGADVVHLDRHAKIALLVPAGATSSSNAIVCGAVMILREAIEKANYDWKTDGGNLPEAMMAILQKTGKPVPDPATKLTFRRLDLQAALEHVFPLNKK